MGQAKPIRVRRLRRIEREAETDVVLTWDVDGDASDQLVMVMDVPTLKDGVALMRAIMQFQ